MSNDDILSRVIEVFSTMTEAEEITAESELIDDLEISSMDVLFLLTGLEEDFGVKIPEKEIRKMATIADVVDVITALRK